MGTAPLVGYDSVRFRACDLLHQRACADGEPADEPVRPAAESGTDPAASGDQAGSVDRWMCGRGTTDEQYSYAIQDPRLTDAASRKIT